MTLYIDATTEREVEDYPLSPGSVEALWTMEDRHFWHKARAAWILRALVKARLAPLQAFLKWVAVVVRSCASWSVPAIALPESILPRLLYAKPMSDAPMPM